MSGAFERRLSGELRAARPPLADAAERRAWEVVRAAHAARPPARPWRAARRLALAAVVAVAAAALVLTPAGAKVGDWIDDVVSPAPEATRSTLSSLPAAGRLLVVADGSAWLVRDDGARDQLGRYDDVTWSPGGLFLAAAGGRELTALDPLGNVRWTRPASGPVSAPRWSPDGYRIAYRSGAELHVATADNADDWPLARMTGAAPPAWKPLPEPAEQVLAFAAGSRVQIVEVDTRRVLGRTPPGPAPRELWWAQDGRRLVAVTPGSLRIHGPRGRLLRVVELPAGWTASGSAIAPGGQRLALIARRGASSRLLMVRLDRPGAMRPLFSASGAFTGLTWSVDGSLLVVGVPAADQWWFVRPRDGGRIEELVRHIRRPFAGGGEPLRGTFPRPAGWCYAEPDYGSAGGQRPCSPGSAPP